MYCIVGGSVQFTIDKLTIAAGVVIVTVILLALVILFIKRIRKTRKETYNIEIQESLKYSTVKSLEKF